LLRGSHEHASLHDTLHEMIVGTRDRREEEDA
jgi:hypothetical protein